MLTRVEHFELYNFEHLFHICTQIKPQHRNRNQTKESNNKAAFKEAY